MKTTLLIALLCIVTSSLFAIGGDMGVGTNPNTNGSEADPYLIEDLADFDTFANPANAATYWAAGVHTKLMTDIDLSGRTYTTAVIAPDTNPSTYGFQGTKFSGIFNGNNFHINYLEINTSGANNDWLGLFGWMEGIVADVKNLVIKDTTIVGGNGSDYMGVLAGYNVLGNITNCHCIGSISGGYTIGGLVGNNSDGIIMDCSVSGSINGGGSTGGVVGFNRNEGQIKNSYFVGSVSGSATMGGLVGQHQGFGFTGTIQNCYSMGSVNGTNAVGGLIGSSFSCSIINCYSASQVNGTGYYVGGFAGNISYPSNIISCFWDIDTSGQIGSSGGKGLITSQMKSIDIYANADWADEGWVMDDGNDYPRLAWEDTVGIAIPEASAVPLLGNGTVDDPYQIWTAEDFATLSWYTSILNKYVTLMTDIDASGKLLYPIGDLGDFTGFFDGDGFIIENLNINQVNSDYVSVFSKVGTGGQISNLTVNNVDIQGRSYVGGLVGSNSSGTISSCQITGSLTGSVTWRASTVGGLVAENQAGTITNCYSWNSTSGDSAVGGFVGNNRDGSIVSCCAMGSVLGSGSNVGGFVGNSQDGNVLNCYSMTSISGTTAGAGGFIGKSLNSSIGNCYATGSVSSGGFCGHYSGGIFTACFWDIQTSGSTDGVIGINPDPTGVMGRTTAEMMTQSTFTGWDFTTPVWMMLREGEDYPRLAWQETFIGDIAGLYGVDMVDFAYLANYWGQDCDSPACDRADVDESGTVDLPDLAAVANDWLR